MYKGFCEDLEYVFGLLFKPFEGCCEKDENEDDDEEKQWGMACDEMPCFREDEDKEDDDEDNDEDSEKGPAGVMLGPGFVQDIMKCLFDASDVDYDYED